MIGIPADRTADMKQDFGHERQRGGEFVVDRLRRMVMPHVHAEQFFARERIGEVEIIASDDIFFAADAEKFSLHGVFDFGAVFFAEDFIQRINENLARVPAVCGNVFGSVGNPCIVDDDGIQLL